MNHVGYTFILCPVFQGGQAIPDHRRNDRGLLFILWQQKDPGLGSYLETPETGQTLESKSFYPLRGNAARRTLARDLGEALGSGAFLGSLRRTRTGGFRVEDALSLSEVLAVLPPRSE